MHHYHVQAFNDHYSKGTSFLQRYAMIEGNSPELGWFAKWQIKRGIRELNKALQIYPNSWQANFFLGKAWQSLGKSTEAISSFTEAAALEPNDYNPLRELSYEFMVNGIGDQAEKFARAAVQLAPDNDALRCNLALALVINSKIDEALVQSQAAIELNDHPINTNTHRIISRIVKAEIKQFKCLKRDGSIAIEPT